MTIFAKCPRLILPADVPFEAILWEVRNTTFDVDFRSY